MKAASRSCSDPPRGRRQPSWFLTRTQTCSHVTLNAVLPDESADGRALTVEVFGTFMVISVSVKPVLVWPTTESPRRS